MRHHPLIWSLNTITQKQFKYDPAAEIVHKGPLMDVLDKLLPSMGRTDIPSHVIAIINFHGPGVLEMPGVQRWDGLRLHYRNDNANLILDYDAYKSNLSVTSIKQDGTISIESMSELKLDRKFNEEDKMKDDTLKTGFSEVNEMLEINGGIQRGDLSYIPNRWLGESEINPEAIEYAALPSTAELTDITGTKGIVVHEDSELELKLRNELRRARDRNNARVGALGEPLGSIEEVIKAKQALTDYLRDKPPVKLIVPDAQSLGRLRTLDPSDITLEMGKVRHSAPRLTMLKVRSPNAEFDGDQIQVSSGMERLRRMQWRTRNPDIATFIKEGRELYEGDFKPIAVLKTNFEDYVLLVNLVRRDIYRNDMFLSAALLIKALYSWGGVVRADRKTALRFIKKTYAKCVSERFRPWFTHSIWEYKDQVIRSMLMDGSKREFIGNKPGMHRRVLSNDIRTCPTITRQCMTGDDKDK